LEIDNFNAGITQMDDIVMHLNDFKKVENLYMLMVTLYLKVLITLGSVADKYYLNPAGLIELKGLSTEVTFFKNFAEKYGIGIQVIRHGKFKAAVEPF
jgi:protease-4